jgi:AcrR family transcriptional regulator
MKEIVIKKPQQARSKQKFGAILSACPRILGEFGYAKSTAAKMALEADVGIGTFYDYFSCKEAAFIAYLDDRLNNALESVAQNVRDTTIDYQRTLRELIQTGIDFAFEHRDIIKLVFTNFPDEIHRIHLEQSRIRLENIAMDFAGNKQLTIADKDPALMMYTLTNLVLGFQFRIVVMPEECFDREVIVDELTDMVRAYLFHS